MKKDKLIKLFNEILSIDSDYTETEKIQLDNLDEAILILDTNNELVVENEYGTQYSIDELSKAEINVFEFVLKYDLNKIKNVQSSI